MGNQAVSLRSFPLFRSAVPVGRRQKKPPSSVPQALHSTKKNSSLKISNCFFALPRSSSSHVLYPTFGRANASTIPLHSVSLRKLRYTTFQPYYVCRPQCFQRLLLRTAIGVCSVITLHLNKERQRLTYIFSPSLHAAIPAFHFAIATLYSRSSVAVRLPQHRHFAPHTFRYNSAIATF